jgi:hypothetical protein
MSHNSRPFYAVKVWPDFFFSAWPTLREIKFAATVNLTARVPRGIITTYTFQTPWVLPCGFANTVDG